MNIHSEIESEHNETLPNGVKVYTHRGYRLMVEFLESINLSKDHLSFIKLMMKNRTFTRKDKHLLTRLYNRHRDV